MTEIERQIQAVANEHGITFEQAAKSSADSLTKVYNDPDVKFKYKNGSFKSMRRLDDHYLNAVLSEALTERLEEWMS